ncbi:MAG: bifunctional demethylmenaquinone methyltransferase/2-methoxy-6-polyprenyl-1,4-benzoquinol methylase UbiE [Dysgonamonadaceae bacterium]|jgi:demethylmenaquinone methyltransferase/2-methoxy-6-polyprenyl-1,4-benzoquinol methylase|nr:bifunctional demethylmenaquinone methyltransferase/2-methoxy-6-polyprenyl-1,4-benzoquinol methylase UbiE [Dysgonamonadaceae bacterium]
MAYQAEKTVPYASGGASKSEQIALMFNEIASKYDRLNHSLSWGIDRSWRKKGISALKALAPKNLLDIATGTGDLAIEACRLLQPKKIVGIDISEKMMAVGRKKVAGAGLSGVIGIERQDCADLRFEDNFFDAATVAFGVRNFGQLDRSLREILRVLKPGGKLMMLELTAPKCFPIKQAYQLYSKLIPFIGNRIAGNRTAYRYLTQSIAVFPQGKEMTAILEKNGFQDVACKRFTFGICLMYIGSKQHDNNLK